MIDPNKDGIDHINIYSNGKTELGRFLSNFAYCPMWTQDGKFHSVEGYWHWLGISNNCKEKDQLRNVFGMTAKRIGTELRKKYEPRFDDDFQKKILKAIWHKFRRNCDLLFDHPEYYNLPFEHYYIFGGSKVVDVKDKYEWMIDGIENMRILILKEVR